LARRAISTAAATVFLTGSTALFAAPPRLPTFCNPIDLPYRFQLEAPSRREAADPSMVYYKGEWWLFASKSGGYWHTKDFSDWKFVEPTGLPLEEYAPTAEIIDGKLCFSMSQGSIFTTDDPAAGKWTKIGETHGSPDMDLFVDTDGRLYLYYGCSDKDPIKGEELDPKQGFKTVKGPETIIFGKPLEHGWEGKRKLSEAKSLAEDEKNPPKPYIEGSWMTKANGHYYLQYAGPGTELDNYADGVYVSDKPLGPFTFQPSNPVSFRPTGFAPGAGHGSTFKDARGNYWHIATVTIAQRHMFERRLAMYPVKFFVDGQMAANTYLGDYPQFTPGTAPDPFNANAPGWMLLSLGKPVTASSELEKFPATNAVDELIKTWWSAKTGDPNEWLQVDLGGEVKIQAVQISFADQDSTTLDRLRGDAYRYLVEVSDDGKTWKTLIDKKDNQRDAPHDYTQLSAPVMGRYVKLTNLHTPAGAKFSVSGLRVFGNGSGPLPAKVNGVAATRDPADGRAAKISWAPAKDAEFYIVRYGVRPDRLFTNFQVYGATDLSLSTLNVGVPYFVTVDAVNSTGVTLGSTAVPMK
jgi:hypothetical protein